ncbi:MmgE/PrpD family protein [Puniceibacterium sp. IMCC21224]|uniref:MmgE/PrpD family protein n=1 Tax=Puniceibacterium sp. IMCC21224 TaxID=1618204 RepID=UPI00065D7450|nr:MmgE/PrpD family protein [Puniceibacterium sp. IMCC21224]KMK64857.1 uncharacterized protein involved in propionate catabolism [Puniceibacterium sp. IMCC21224]
MGWPVSAAVERSGATPERALAAFASGFHEIPDAVLHEGRRALVNIFATAFTGCREQPVEAMLRAGMRFSSGVACTLIGRSERVDLPLAASINTAGANIFDFDDTHEATIIHPAAAVYSGLFAHAELHGATGRDVLKSFVLGCEVECRVGNAVSPYHYAHGWHITSTCGIFGAAAASGRLIGLTDEQMIDAFSCAAAQSSGMVETLGTGAKSVSMGGAARNGYISAQLAAEGCGGSARPLSAPRGYLNVYGKDPVAERLTDALGQTWEFAANTYKPYPVGVVLNPVLEGILDLREAEGLRLEQVARIELSGHPLLQQRTDRPLAATGRETQVSAQHAIAIALLTGQAGLDEFSDAAAHRTIAAGRPDVQFDDDSGREVASVRLVVHLVDGRTLTREIAQAAGSRGRPLSDAQIEAKFVAAAERADFAGDMRGLLDALWSIDDAADAGDIIRMAGH